MSNAYCDACKASIRVTTKGAYCSCSQMTPEQTCAIARVLETIPADWPLLDFFDLLPDPGEQA